LSLPNYQELEQKRGYSSVIHGDARSLESNSAGTRQHAHSPAWWGLGEPCSHPSCTGTATGPCADPLLLHVGRP